MIAIEQNNRFERIVWWSILCTIPLWLIGGLYIVGSILGWILCILKLLDNNTNDKQNSSQINILILSWLIGSFVLLICLFIGHYNFELGLLTTLKSSIGWAKGWALFPLYMLCGLMPIKKEIIVRSIALNCIFILVILIVGIILFLFGIQGSIYTSPLRFVSPGNTDAFFDFSLYYRDIVTNIIKVRLFTPWSPALGLLANIYFWIIINESSLKIRNIALLSVFSLCIVSGSRAAIASIVIIPTILFISRNVRGYLVFYAASLSTAIATIYYDAIITFSSDSWQQVRNLRSDSSRVRSLLTEISLQRWIDEAFWWGHGIVIKGPKLVEYILIGTHNTWVHLLYAKGLIGLIAFLVPMLILLILSLFNFIKNKTDKLSTSCLGISLVLWQYTISENLEMLAYLYWPGLILVGISFSKNNLSKTSFHRIKLK